MWKQIKHIGRSCDDCGRCDSPLFMNERNEPYHHGSCKTINGWIHETTKHLLCHECYSLVVLGSVP